METAFWSNNNPQGWKNINIEGLPVNVQFGPNSATQRHATVSGTTTVTPYFGINCRRIKSIHGVLHGNTVLITSQTTGECF